jgi:folylpolyglutamate synthase/dihydropteroate synthase
LENIRGNIGDAFIWIAVDGTTDSVGHFIANLLAAKLNIEVHSNPHLISYEDLHHTNHSTVARFVHDGF